MGGGTNKHLHSATEKALRLGQSGNWSDKALRKAMNAVTNESMKVKAASWMFGIRATSLKVHLYGKTRTKQRGNHSTLKLDEEKKLVDYIFKMQDLKTPTNPYKALLEK